MSKRDDAIAAFQAAQVQAAGALYDAGVADGGGSSSSSDDGSQLAAAQAKIQELQSELDAETAKESADEKVIAAKQAVIDQIAAILSPAPAPAPVAS